jgi:hypothetical protein
MTTHDSTRRDQRGPSARRAAIVIVLACAAALCPAPGRAQALPGIDVLLMRVAERIEEFYRRAQQVICTEISRVQPIGLDYAPRGFARTVESQLRVETDGGDTAEDATVVREIQKVNGQAPREGDKRKRDGCTDPNPLSTEPLAFLLPAHRSEYRFSSAGLGKERNRPAFLIDFASAERKSDLELIEDKAGHDDCFDWSGPLAERGRVWVDADTYDVLRVERSLSGPIDVTVPLRIQRRQGLGMRVGIMRNDTTTRYRTVAFTDPDEVLLLPESIHSTIVVSGGLQSTRRTRVYSDFRRFVTGARVVVD